LAEQADLSWIDALSDDELLLERAAAEELRALGRAAKLNEPRDAHDRQERQRRRTDEETYADADAAYQRVASPTARVGRLFRSSRWVSRALTGLAGIGVVWGSFNVQHNLMAGG
jgi:hypothetical protein